ncbi:MAG: hypothetical protein HQ518_30340 [Rhodopirellula sp.]|nr:hypothetical protein [Rhodopirellula sp.]
MNTKCSITNQPENYPGVRFAVGWHFAIGLLLMWLDPLASMFGEQAGQIIGLRDTHPLLPCLGLFWMLVAAALVRGRRFVIKAAMVVHCASLLLPLAGIVLAVILLLPPEPRGHMALSPAPVAILLMVCSTVVALFAGVSLFSLWRLLKNPSPSKPLWSNQTRGFVTATLILFVLRLLI